MIAISGHVVQLQSKISNVLVASGVPSYPQVLSLSRLENCALAFAFGRMLAVDFVDADGMLVHEVDFCAGFTNRTSRTHEVQVPVTLSFRVRQCAASERANVIVGCGRATVFAIDVQHAAALSLDAPLYVDNRLKWSLTFSWKKHTEEIVDVAVLDSSDMTIPVALVVSFAHNSNHSYHVRLPSLPSTRISALRLRTGKQEMQQQFPFLFSSITVDAAQRLVYAYDTQAFNVHVYKYVGEDRGDTKPPQLVLVSIYAHVFSMPPSPYVMHWNRIQLISCARLGGKQFLLGLCRFHKKLDVHSLPLNAPDAPDAPDAIQDPILAQLLIQSRNHDWFDMSADPSGATLALWSTSDDELLLHRL